MTGNGSLNTEDLSGIFSPSRHATPYGTRQSVRATSASAGRNTDIARNVRHGADMDANGMHMHYNHEFQPRRGALTRSGVDATDPLSQQQQQHAAMMGSDMHDRQFHNGTFALSSCPCDSCTHGPVPEYE
jgi:hypothetical protein